MLKIFLCTTELPTHSYQAILKQLQQEQAQSIHILQATDLVKPAEHLHIHNTQHPKHCFLNWWQTQHQLSTEIIELLDNNGIIFQEYICSESQVLSPQQNIGPQQHYHQVALLKKPEKQTIEKWLDIWLNQHTQVAIDTQSSFLYTQNICLSTKQRGNWPLMNAIVEEGFPLAAMEDREVFFNAKGQPELKAERENTMIQSCVKFIDFENFDCTAMQQTILSE